MENDGDNLKLCGGFKDFYRFLIFTPKLGEMIQFDYSNIFQRGSLRERTSPNSVGVRFGDNTTVVDPTRFFVTDHYSGHA